MIKYLNNKKYLNETYKIKKNFFVKILEKPSLHLSEAEQQKMLKDINIIAKDSSLDNLDYSVFKYEKEFLENGLFTIIYNSNLKPIAFNIQMFMNCYLRNISTPVLHIGLVVINPEYQSMGFATSLYDLTTFLMFLKNKFRPIWISSVTQVPSVFGSVAEAFEEVYPTDEVTETIPPYDHLQLVRQVMTNYRFVFGVGAEADFDENAFIIKNSYTGGSDNLKKTFEQSPKHRKDAFNQYCLSNLDYERGDDFIQIGQINFKIFIKVMLSKRVDNPVQVPFIKLLFLILEIVVNPIINWFDSKEQFGVLRPR